MNKVLFITPFGGSSGSEMMIYSLFKSFNSQRNSAFFLFSCQPGKIAALEKENKKVSYFNPEKNTTTRISQRLKKYLWGNEPIEQELLNFHKAIDADFWYINTIITPWAVQLAIKNNIPFLVHFHELPSLYQELTSIQWQNLITHSKYIIACSEIVKSRVIQAGFSNKVFKINECIDVGTINKNANQNESAFSFPENAKIWVCSGMTTYRKGVDIVADILALLPENYYILWLGPVFQNGLTDFLKKRSELEFQNRLIFSGELSGQAYYSTLKNANGFLLTSREDPYPLVMLEAATLGLPIVSFNSGGISEFFKPGMGVLFNDFSASNFAEAIVAVDSQNIEINTALLKEEGMKHDIEQIKKIWLSDLKELLDIN